MDAAIKTSHLVPTLFGLGKIDSTPFVHRIEATKPAPERPENAPYLGSLELIFTNGIGNHLYRNNLKNRFLTASALPENSRLHSALASGQWSLAPAKNFEAPSCTIHAKCTENRPK